MSQRTLADVCALFWQMQKPAQDALLWSMQDFSAGPDARDENGSEDEESGESVQVRKKWFLCGQQLCRRSFARFLGVGQSRLQRTKERFQGYDERRVKGATSTKAALSTASVNVFLQKMYFSLSETMPEGLLACIRFVESAFRKCVEGLKFPSEAYPKRGRWVCKRQSSGRTLATASCRDA